IGFGEVGRTLAEDLSKAEAELSAFDILFANPDSAPSKALAQTSVRVGLDTEDTVREAELIISAVTAASDIDVARAAASGIAKGAFFLDLNSVSPAVKHEGQKIIEEAGGRYVEAAVMTPIEGKRIASPMLLGGIHSEEFLARAGPLGFSAEIFSQEIGQASAAKMCRSVIIKGVEALISESMLAARGYGVEKAVLDSLSDLLPNPDWEEFAAYLISRALQHGVRRAEEMREAAKTVEETGIEPFMASATVQRQDWSAVRKHALAQAGDLGAML
ncbi:MAG: NAD(P)-dependent oxidoreductase, partial [Desulfuromonadales bacterium]|nr:NAD(P)-dependent oxidoreductase [Desulfuromonadales bacterium]